METSEYTQNITFSFVRLIIDPKVHMHDHSALCESIHNTEHPS